MLRKWSSFVPRVYIFELPLALHEMKLRTPALVPECHQQCEKQSEPAFPLPPSWLQAREIQLDPNPCKLNFIDSRFQNLHIIQDS